MKLTSNDYLELDWNIANSNKVETVNTKINRKIPALLVSTGNVAAATDYRNVFHSSGYFRYPYTEAYPEGTYYIANMHTDYYTSTGSITITFDQPISGVPIIDFVSYSKSYKTDANKAALTSGVVPAGSVARLQYFHALLTGGGIAYDLRDRVTPNDMPYEQTDTTIETKLYKGVVNYPTERVTQKILNQLGTPTKNDYWVDLNYHRWKYDGLNWVDEFYGVYPCSLVRFWPSFNTLGTKFITEGSIKLNTYVDQHDFSDYGYGAEYDAGGYKAGNRPMIDDEAYTYTMVGSKAIKIDYTLINDVLLWVYTSQGATRNYVGLWYNSVVRLSVKMESDVITYSFSLDANGNLTHTATNKYPLSIDTSNLVDENTLVGTAEYDHTIAKNVLDAFKGGRYTVNAKVSMYWVRDNLVTIDSVVQVKLLDGKYISRSGSVCNFKVTSIEGVFEQGQSYYNIALLEE